MRRSRVLLADDHALMLDGIRNLLKTSYRVVGAVEDGKALVAAAISLKPDLIILDIAMPLLNGIDAAREIRKNLPEVKLLFVTMHTSPTYLQAALESGANGYAVKSSGRKEILAAVAEVLRGRLYITPGVGGDDVDRLANASRAADPATGRGREQQEGSSLRPWHFGKNRGVPQEQPEVQARPGEHRSTHQVCSG